jgi:hypothetical protein
MLRLPPGSTIRRSRGNTLCRTCKKAIPKGTTVLAYHTKPDGPLGEHVYEHQCPNCARPLMR